LIEKAEEEDKDRLEGYEYNKEKKEWEKDEVNVVDKDKLESAQSRSFQAWRFWRW
jgi:hypothetical protein